MKKSSIIKKVIFSSLTIFIVGSVILATTLAWMDVSQHNSNEFKGLKLTETGSAALGKLDKETGKALAGAEFELYKVVDEGKEIVIGRYTSNQNGMIWVDHLKEGNYYWLEIRPPYGWTYDKDDDGNDIKKYPFTLELNENGEITPEVLRAYNQRLYADLVISKTVVRLSNPDILEEVDEEAEEGSSAPQSPGTDETPDGTGGLSNEVVNEVVNAEAGGETNTEANEVVNAETGEAAPPGPAPVNTPKGADATVFDFTIEFSDLEDNTPLKLIIGGEEKEVLIANGQLKLQLTDGQAAVIKNVPVGIYYNIIETPVDGYIMSAEQYRGTVPPGGISVPIVNYFTNQEPGKLIVKKIVTGNGADLGKEFIFVVTIDGEDNTFTLKHGEQREFTLAPNAVYSVQERSYLEDGYETSANISIMHDENHGIVVKVKQSNHYIGPVFTEIKGEKTWDLAGQNIALPESIKIMLKDGNVVVEEIVVKPDAQGKWSYSFIVPKYRPDGVTEIDYSVAEAPMPGFIATFDGYNIRNTRINPETVVIPTVKKSVSGHPKEKAEFKFRLIGEGGAPMPAGSNNGEKIITITGAGEANFGQIQYTEIGTWRYTITEVQAGEYGWAYDKTIYILNVNVSEKNGVLSCAKTLVETGSTQEHEKAEFINVYDKDGHPEEPGGSRGPGGGRPQTGDENNIWLWALILIASALTLRIFLLRQSAEKRGKA